MKRVLPNPQQFAAMLNNATLEELITVRAKFPAVDTTTKIVLDLDKLIESKRSGKNNCIVFAK